ncbi:MAG TPA: YcgN family cysteine cluster protein [Negativicutes bacterium]|nr:YcgN family cysteine cluster protein [Negativicutes bacterium]
MHEFWKEKPLEDMTRAEWESLCDGCAQCCIIKFEDEDTGRIYHTNVVCQLLDIFHCRCTRYDERSVLVPMCLTLTPAMIRDLKWMPETCAYRLLAEGKDLPLWHPLVSGDANTVHKAGISVRGKVVSAVDVPEDELPDYVVDDD